MITRYKKRAFRDLGISFVFFVLLILLGAFRPVIPKVVFAVVTAIVLPFTLIFYIQGNITLAKARGYEGAVVVPIILIGTCCCGAFFFAMPLIIFFGLEDKTGKRRPSSDEPEPTHRNPPAVLPPRRDQSQGDPNNPS